MTEEALAILLAKLERKLGLDPDDVEEETVDQLSDALTDAESELLLYLGVCRLKEVFYPKLVELAALLYRRDAADAQQSGAKEVSVTEDGLNQKITYLSPGDYQTQAQGIFNSLARFRQVRVR